MRRDAFSRLFRAVTKYYSTATASRNIPLFMVVVGISFRPPNILQRGLCWKGSFKRAQKEKKNRELVKLIFSAVTKTVHKEQNTNGLIITGGNSSFKC